MDETQARKILFDCISDTNGGLFNVGWYLYWNPAWTEATLDGEFTADALEAIAWWMRNRKEEQ